MLETVLENEVFRDGLRMGLGWGCWVCCFFVFFLRHSHYTPAFSLGCEIFLECQLQGISIAS